MSRSAYVAIHAVSRATASGHLSKLVAARLLTVTRERRFSYYRIASPLVATMLESIKVDGRSVRT
jgi:DNA-binding transcriptional ArsR family regulator